jgi:hypothetical protein
MSNSRLLLIFLGNQERNRQRLAIALDPLQNADLHLPNLLATRVMYLLASHKDFRLDTLLLQRVSMLCRRDLEVLGGRNLVELRSLAPIKQSQLLHLKRR